MLILNHKVHLGGNGVWKIDFSNQKIQPKVYFNTCLKQ